ncbi:hypothetical protein LIA77_07241 [Sarocladium implicatum]|nr:hypothetical protein LIA77_07241 [Sarocladium implicatum]
MGRKLPWKTGEAAPTPTKTERNAATDSPRPAAGVRRAAAATRSSSPPGLQTVLPVTPNKRKELMERDFTRSPSTSPPPEPPKPELMVPGVAHDDRFRMVEDELLSIARQFTAHLHRVEYARLKTLAANQNAAAIREIERPVVGSGKRTAEGVRRGEQKRRDARQRRVAGVGEEEGGEVRGGLRGLLESPGRDRRRVGEAVRRQRSERAKAGDDEQRTSPGGELPRQPPASNSRGAPSSSSRLSSTPVSKIEKSSPPIPRVKAKEVAVIEIDDDDDDDDPFGMKRRRARREKSREKLRMTERSSSRGDGDIMPSF